MNEARVFILIVLFAFTASAQKKKEPKADQVLKTENLFADGMKYFVLEKNNEARMAFEKVLEIDPNNAAAENMLAKTLAISDLVAATPHAKKAVELSKSNEHFKRDLADLFLKQGELEKAEKLLADLCQAAPNDFSMAFEWANVLVLQSKFKETIEVYNGIEKQLGITEEITHQKQLVYFRMNKVNDAIAEGEKLIAANPADEQMMAKQAQLLISFEKYDAAERLIEKIKKINDNLPETSVMLAEIYRKKGKTQSMETELKTSFENPNLDAATKIKILQTYMLTLKPSESIDNVVELTQKLIKQSPNEPKAYIILGDLLTKKNQKKEGRDAYLKAAKLDGSSYEVWAAVLQLDNDLGQTDSVGKHAEAAIEFFPNQPFLWYNSGFSHYVGKNYSGARLALEEAKNLSQNDDFTKQLNILLGDVYNSLALHEQSDAAYDAVLAVDADNDHVLNNYSYFLALKKQNLEKALTMSTKLVAKNANNPTFLDTHAWVLFVKGDYAEAKKVMETLMGLQKNVSETIMEHYGDILFKMGDTSAALEQWKKAFNKQKNNHKLKEKIDRGVWVE